MRPSPKRHVVALLRLELGFEQRKFAPIIGCSVETLRSVELGRLPLSDNLAEKIFMTTGVSLDWLKANDLKAEMIASDGSPYDPINFEMANWRIDGMIAPEIAAAECDAGLCIAKILVALSGARRKGYTASTVALRRLSLFGTMLMQEFAPDAPTSKAKPEKGDCHRVVDEFARALKSSERWYAKEMAKKKPARPAKATT